MISFGTNLKRMIESYDLEVLTDIPNKKIWQDPDTNLIWQVKIEDKKYIWRDIQKYADKLNREKYGGYNDWRVPTLNELKTILIKKKYNSLYIKEPLSKLKYNVHWSSSEDLSDAWAILFYYGGINRYSKTHKYYVRCVRGIQKI